MKKVTVVSGVLLLLLIAAGLLLAAGERSSDRFPAGGLTELAPDRPLGRNAVGNPGFESGDADWKLGRCWSIDQAVAHQGSHSLKAEAGAGCMPAETIIPRSPGGARSYVLRGWVRTSEAGKLKARLSLHDQNDKGFILGETEFASPGAEWQLIERRDIDLLPIHDGHALKVAAQVQGASGSAWFDDIELLEEEPLPLSVFLLYPNFRGYLWSGGPQAIRLRVEVGAPNVPNAKIRITLKRETEDAIRPIERPAQVSQEIEIDGSSLLLGSYLLGSELVGAANGKELATYPAYRITKVGDDFRSTLVNYISPDNYLVRKGKKRFVWGVYDRFSGKYRCRNCLSTDKRDYEQIPGFNGMSTVENYVDTQVNAEINILPFAGVNPQKGQLDPWLEVLDRRGIGHLQIMVNWEESRRYRPAWAKDLSDPDLWKLAVQAMKGKPAIGYYTYDEPKPDKIPSVFSQYKILRDGNPGDITYGVLINARQVFRWRDLSDALGCDPYPIGTNPTTDDVAYGATSAPAMLRTSAWTREAIRQVHGSRPVWMVLQLFRIAGQFPNYEQMKMQAYKAIINGATGIFWWGFVSERGLEDEWFQRGNHQPYLDFRRISREVMALEPVLISPPQPELVSSVSNPDVEFLVKSDAERLVIFASNFGENSLGKVTFTLAPAAQYAGNEAEVYGEDRAIPLAAAPNRKSGAALTDVFGPYQVHVYRLKLK